MKAKWAFVLRSISAFISCSFSQFSFCFSVVLFSWECDLNTSISTRTNISYVHCLQAPSQYDCNPRIYECSNKMRSTLSASCNFDNKKTKKKNSRFHPSIWWQKLCNTLYDSVEKVFLVISPESIVYFKSNIIKKTGRKKKFAIALILNYVYKHRRASREDAWL